jgi:hypothetical protein
MVGNFLINDFERNAESACALVYQGITSRRELSSFLLFRRRLAISDWRSIAQDGNPPGFLLH